MLNDPSNRIIERATFANLRSHSDSSASSAHNLCSKTSEIMQIFFMLYHYKIKITALLKSELRHFTLTNVRNEYMLYILKNNVQLVANYFLFY